MTIERTMEPGDALAMHGQRLKAIYTILAVIVGGLMWGAKQSYALGELMQRQSDRRDQVDRKLEDLDTRIAMHLPLGHDVHHDGTKAALRQCIDSQALVRAWVMTLAPKSRRGEWQANLDALRIRELEALSLRR